VRENRLVPQVSVTEQVSADPVNVYRLVSDITRMGEWSPDTTSAGWLGGTREAGPGARFRGHNRRGFRRWATTCTVISAEPGRRFAFRVSAGPFPIAEWSYDFVAVDGGCEVTEGWDDQRPGWLRQLAPIVMGIPDYAEHNERSMHTTLAALKRAAESGFTPAS
jgi:hypothetical protein